MKHAAKAVWLSMLPVPGTAAVASTADCLHVSALALMFTDSLFVYPVFSMQWIADLLYPSLSTQEQSKFN